MPVTGGPLTGVGPYAGSTGPGTVGRSTSTGNLTAGVLSPVQVGYQNALASIAQALKIGGGVNTAQRMGLQNQLLGSQGKMQERMAASGIGDSSIYENMRQAPLQTYNLGMANLNNDAAQRAMQMYVQMANLQSAGGQAQSNLLAPFALGQQQQNFNSANRQSTNNQQNLLNQMASLQNAFNQMNQPTNYGLHSSGGSGTGSSDQVNAQNYNQYLLNNAQNFGSGGNPSGQSQGYSGTPVNYGGNGTGVQGTANVYDSIPTNMSVSDMYAWLTNAPQNEDY